MTPSEAYSTYMHRAEVLRLYTPRTVARLGAMAMLAAQHGRIYIAPPDWYWESTEVGYTYEMEREDTR